MHAAGGAELHFAEGALPGLEHGHAAGLQRGEELQLGVAVFLRQHDLAARGHARQQRQAEVMAGLADRARVAGADAEARARQGRGLRIGRAADGAGAGHGLGHFLGDGLDALQRLARAQGHFEHADAAGHQGACQRHGVLHVMQHDHGDHGGVAHHVQRGELVVH